MDSRLIWLCMFVFLLVLMSPAEERSEISTIIPYNVETNQLEAYTEHDPVSISGNADFAGQGWPGNGTPQNPYLIEGLSIVDSSTGISIRDTTVYFEIKDCLISAPEDASSEGITLNNVTNAMIVDCIVESHYHGMVIWKTSNSTITNNDASENHDCGFKLGMTSNSVLTNNTAGGNRWRNGFFVSYCDNCSIIDNVATDNGAHGIYLHRSLNCTVKDNVLTGNGFMVHGSFLRYWLHNVSGNMMNGKPLAYVTEQSNVVIDGNQYAEVFLVNCSGVTVRDGVFVDASLGVQILYSSNCSLVNNTAAANYETGFDLRYSNSCIVVNNTATDNKYGFEGSSCNNLTLMNNTAIDSLYEGFRIVSSDQAVLANNTATENRHGFNLGSSEYCTVINNTATGNSGVGLILHRSPGCVVANNSVTAGFSIEGIELSSWLHTFSGNTVNGRPLGYFKSINDTIIDGSNYAQMILVNCSNSTFRNGVFSTVHSGIQLAFSRDCTLSNNTAIETSSSGISVMESQNCILRNNAVNKCSNGFHVHESVNLTLLRNTANENRNYGFYISECSNCANFGNTASENEESGFLFTRIEDCTVENSTSTSNENHGFVFFLSSFSNATNNTASSNQRNGFFVEGDHNILLNNNTSSYNSQDGFHIESSSTDLIWNVATHNARYGICLTERSARNMVFLNKIGYNGEANGFDNGGLNSWDNGTYGNCWSDYEGTGNYSISGSANSWDFHPFTFDGFNFTTITTEATTPDEIDPRILYGIAGAVVGLVIVLLLYFIRREQ